MLAGVTAPEDIVVREAKSVLIMQMRESEASQNILLVGEYRK